MKIRTKEEMIEYLYESLAWRKKELHTLRLQIKKHPKDNVLLRAAVVMAYAHWEGFVRDSLQALVSYINSCKIAYNDAKENLITMKIMHELRHHVEQENIAEITTVVQKITSSSRLSFSKRKYFIDIGMLTWKKYKKVLLHFDISSSSLVTKQKFVDERLIETRNKIAHGEYYTGIDHDIAFETLSEVINIIDNHFTVIEDYVNESKYRKS